MTQRGYTLVRLLRLLLFASVLFVTEALAQTLQIINAEGQSTNVTAAQIESLPHVTVDTRDHDRPARFEGVPLSAVLSMQAFSLARRCGDRA